MTFIPNGSWNLRVGRRVRLTRDVKVLKGTFTKGHELTITNIGPRGPDMIDDNGEKLSEMFDPKDYELI